MLLMYGHANIRIIVTGGHVSTVLRAATDKLRNRYLTHLPPAKADWLKHCVYDYVRLALVGREDVTRCNYYVDELTSMTHGGIDQILKRKTPIYDLRDIFHCNNEDRLILIMGGPGE